MLVSLFLRSDQKRVQQATEKTKQREQALSELLEKSRQIALHWKEQADRTFMDAQRDSLQLQIESFEEALLKFLDGQPGKENFLAIRKDWLNLRQHLLSLASGRQDQPMLKHLEDSIQTSGQRLQSSLRDLQGNLVQRLENKTFMILKYQWLLLLVAVAIVIGGWVMLSRQIIKPLKSIKERVNYILSTGDFHQRVDLHCDDEIRDIANCFNQVGQRMETISQQNQQLTDENIRLSQRSEVQQREINFLENQYRELVENINDIILILDTQGSIIYVNSMWKEKLGHERSEVIGKKYESFIHPEDVHNFRKGFNKIRVEKAKISNLTFRIQHRREEWRWHVFNGTPSLDIKGEPSKILAITHDITERITLERQIRGYARYLEVAISETEKAKGFLESVLQNTPSGLFTVDRNGKIQTWNKAAERITGYSAQEIIGRSCDLLRSGDCQQGCFLFSSGRPPKPYSGECVVTRKDGQSVILSKNTDLLRDENGQIVGGIESFIDITQRKEMEEALIQERNKFKSMLEGLKEAIVYVNQHDQIVEMNSYAEKFLKIKRPEAMGKKLDVLGYKDIVSKAKAIIKIFRENPNQNLSAMDCRIANRWFDVRFSAVRDNDGNYLGLILDMIDITRRKRTQQQLKEAYEKLKEVDKMKSDFLSNVSHELRTPLTSIASSAKIMLKYGDKKPGTVHRFSQIILDESERLARLINDVLDLAKIESGQIEWRMDRINLKELMDRILRIGEPAAKNKDLEIRVENIDETLPRVFGDFDRLVQVLINLVSNAIKFTPEGGCITLSARKLDENFVEISVRDTGIGIAKEDQRLIFEKFKQVGDTLTEKPKGTGLGLPICKEIIEHHGGRIWVESEPGKGSTFKFTLPILKVKAEEALSEFETREGSGHSKSILVVDDDLNTLQVVGYTLRRNGYNVICGTRGNEALNLAVKHHPDLIILDILMPGINGYEVLKQLQNNSATKDIPVLILSVLNDKEKGLRSGAKAYFTKPLDEEELLAEIARLTDGRKKILVVDDDRALVESLKENLTERGFWVFCAYNGRQAIEKLEEDPDLLILDLTMPQMDGIQVLEYLKKDPEYQNIPVIVMTCHDSDEVRQEVIKLGAKQFLFKSVDFDQKVIKVVEELAKGS